MYLSRRFALAFSTLTLLGALGSGGCATEAESADSETSDIQKLDGTAVIDAVLDELVRHSPSFAVGFGDRTHDDQVDDLSLAEENKFEKRLRKLDEKLAALDVAALKPKDVIGYDVARSNVAEALAGIQARVSQWEVSSLNDPADNLYYTLTAQSMGNAKQVDDLLERLQRLPAYFDQRIANLEAGRAVGLVASTPGIDAAAKNILDPESGYVTADVAKSRYFTDLVFADTLKADQQAAAKEKIKKAIATHLNPALKKYADYLKTKLLPHARTTNVGLSGMGALGNAYYASRIKLFTGTDMDPKKINALGLDRVKTLEGQMKKELAIVGIDEPTIGKALAKVKTLPEAKPLDQAASTKFVNELVAKLSSDVWSKKVFGSPSPALPDVELTPTPGTAYYVAGTDTVNGKIVFPFADSAPFTQVPRVTHEFTHHLQFLVTKDLKLDPRFGYFSRSSMVEGGAHYAEVEALDSEIYAESGTRSTALNRIAGMGDLMLRAARLVIDSGVHGLGMSREDGLRYLTDHSLLSGSEAEYEIDRYITWPAQAMQYRLGMEAIADERNRARAALGAKFDIAKFNRLVIESGFVEFSTFKKRVDALIASRAK